MAFRAKEYLHEMWFATKGGQSVIIIMLVLLGVLLLRWLSSYMLRHNASRLILFPN